MNIPTAVLGFFGGDDKPKVETEIVEHGTMEEFYDMDANGAPVALNSSGSVSSDNSIIDETAQHDSKKSSSVKLHKPSVSFEIKNDMDRRIMLERQLDALKSTVLRPLKREIAELRQDAEHGKQPQFEVALCSALAFMEPLVEHSGGQLSILKEVPVVDPALGDKVEEDLRKLKEALEKGGQHWRWVYAYHLERFRNLHKAVVDQYKDKLKDVHGKSVRTAQKLKGTKSLLAETADKVCCLKAENGTLQHDLRLVIRDYDRLMAQNKNRRESKSTPVLDSDEYSYHSSVHVDSASSGDSNEALLDEIATLRIRDKEMKKRMNSLQKKLKAEVEYNAKMSEVMDVRNSDSSDSTERRVLVEYKDRIIKLETELTEVHATREKQFEEYNNERAESKNRIVKLETDLADIRATREKEIGEFNDERDVKLQKLQADLDKAVSKKDNAVKRAEKLDAVKKETDSVTQLVQVLNEKVMKKMEEVQNLTAEGNDLRQQLEKSQEDLEKETEIRQKKTQLLEETENANTSLKTELAEVTTKFEKQHVEMEDRTRGATSQSEELDQVRASNATLLVELVGIENELATAQEVVAKSSGLRAELAGLQEQLEVVKQELMSSNEDASAKSQELDESRGTVDALRSELRSLKEQLSSVEEDLSKSIYLCNVKTAELETVKELNGMMITSVDGLREELSKKQAALSESQTLVEKKQEQLDESQAAKDMLVQQMFELEAQHEEEMKSSVDMLSVARQSEEEQLSDLQTRLARAQEELDRSVATCEDQANQIVEYLAAKERLIEEMSVLEIRYAEETKSLAGQVAEAKQSKLQQVSDLQAQLSDAQDKINTSVELGKESTRELGEVRTDRCQLLEDLDQLKCQKIDLETLLESKSVELEENKVANKSLNTDLAALHERFAEIQQTLSESEQDLADSKITHSEQKEELVISRRTTETLRAQILDLQERLSVVEEELKLSTATEIEQKEKLNQSQRIHESLLRDIDGLIVQNQEQSGSAREAMDKIVAAKALENEEARASLENIGYTVIDLQGQLAKAQVNFDRATEELKDARAVGMSLHQNVADLERELIVQLEKMQTEMSSLVETKDAELFAVQFENTKMKHDVEELRSELSISKKDLDTSTDLCTTLKTQLEESQGRNKLLDNDTVALKNQLQEQRGLAKAEREKVLESTKTQSCKLEKDLEGLQSQLSAFEEDLAASTDLCSTLKTQLDESQGRNKSLDNDTVALKNQLEQSDKVKSEMEHVLESTESEKCKLQQDLEELRSELSTFKADLDSSSALCSTLKTQLDESQVRNRSLDETAGSLKSQLKDKTDQAKAEIEKALESSQIQNCKLQQDVEELRSELCTFKEDLVTSTGLCSSLRAQLDETQKLNRSLAKDATLFRDQLQDQTLALESNIVALKDIHLANGSLRANVEDLQRQLEKAQEESVSSEDLNSDAHKKLKEAKVAHKMLCYEIEDLKKELQNELEAAKEAHHKQLTSEEEHRSTIANLNYEIASMKCQLGIASEDKEQLIKVDLNRRELQGTVARLTRQLNGDASVATDFLSSSEDISNNDDSEDRVLRARLIAQAEENSHLADALDEKAQALAGALQQNGLLRDELVHLTCKLRASSKNQTGLTSFANEEEVRDGPVNRNPDRHSGISKSTQSITHKLDGLDFSKISALAKEDEVRDCDDEARDGPANRDSANRDSASRSRRYENREGGLSGHDDKNNVKSTRVITNSLEGLDLSEIPTYN